MNRRDFLRAAGVVSAGLALPARAPLFAFQPTDPWRTFEVLTEIEILNPKGATKAWMPIPGITLPFQKPAGRTTVRANGGSARLHTDPTTRAAMIVAEWPEGVRPSLATTSRVSTRDVAVDLARPGHAAQASLATLRRDLRPTKLLPLDGIVKFTADQATRGATTDVEKARAIYDWIVEKTHREASVRGCGIGDIRGMLETGDLGGKCADLNALYVGLARASGLPSRDLYGIRLAPSKLGYKSLGAAADVISKAQHCRAEVYLRDHGWVPVDPADVRKVMLEEPPGNLPIDDPKVVAARTRLFGSWEMNWMAYNDAHDVALPGSVRPTIPFLMYPQAETADGPIDSLDPDTFRYRITVHEVS